MENASDIQRILQESLTPSKAAEVANVSRQTIYNWLWSGQLPCYKSTSGTTVILRSDLQAVVDRVAASKAAQFERSKAELPDVLDRMREHETHDPHRRHHRG